MHERGVILRVATMHSLPFLRHMLWREMQASLDAHEMPMLPDNPGNGRMGNAERSPKRTRRAGGAPQLRKRLHAPLGQLVAAVRAPEGLRGEHVRVAPFVDVL